MSSTILTLHDPQAATKYYESGVWRSDTFYSLVVTHAANTPDKFAFRDAGRRITWGQALDWVDRLADDFMRRGLREGQRVSLWLPSCIESVLALIACSRNGYVCNPSLHQNYTTTDVVALLRRLDSALLITQVGYGADAPAKETLAGAMQTVPSLQYTYFLDSIDPSAEAAPRLRVPLEAEPERTRSRRRDHPDRIMYLAFTSGTTGEPKGVLHSANTLLSNARALVEDWRHDASTVILSLSPMSHHIGVVAVAQALVAGCELVVNDPLASAGGSSLDWIIASGATYCMGVPTHAIDVLAELKATGKSKLGSVNLFYMAGAPIPSEVARQFLQLGVTPQNIYGMTENSSHQYTLPSDDLETIVSTCGRACRGFDVAVFSVDDSDRQLPVGEIGEIGSQGGCLMLGYFDDQRATERSFNSDGWFMSGDLGRFDENDCLSIVGRIKDLIIRGGYNIHPAPIEAAAMRHDRVDKAALIAVPDPRLGEKGCLVVASREESPPSGEELLEHLNEMGLSKYDMPEFVLQIDEFPLTASGKILKRELVDRVKAGELKPTAIRYRAGSTNNH